MILLLVIIGVVLVLSNYEYSCVCKIQIGNRECVKETTTRPKSRTQLKSINGSSTQQENPALRSVQ